MIKKYLFVLFIFLNTSVGYAQKLDVTVSSVTSDATVNNNIIYYQSDRKLSWDDFKGKPVEGSAAAALTNAGFGIKLAFHRVGNRSQLAITVNCNFSKKDSWVKSGSKTVYILNHEQKHFDIAYLHTLYFIQKLKAATYTNDTYVAVIEKIYNETATAMGTMQNLYDTETSHSIQTEKQADWNTKVSELLEKAIKE